MKKHVNEEDYETCKYLIYSFSVFLFGIFTLFMFFLKITYQIRGFFSTFNEIANLRIQIFDNSK